MRPVPLAVPLILAALQVQAGPVPARWKTAGPVHLGDPVVLEAALPSASPDFFVEGDLYPGADWGEARVAAVDRTPPPSFPGEVRLSVTLQPFAVGDLTLPPARLVLHDEKGAHEAVLSPPPLAVASLLPSGGGPEPPPAPPLPVPRRFPVAALLLLLLAGLLLAGGLLWFRHRRALRPPRPRAAPSLRETDPPRWALGEVERIFAASLPADRRFEALSAVIRAFLAWRYDLPFPDWTLEEIRQATQGLPDLPEGTREAYLEVLSACALVLYARHLPSAGETAGLKARSLEAIAGTPPKARPETQREAAA